jgi:hypothetical protein
MKGELEFQTVKDIVLDALLDFLPEGVNKEKITPVTLKVIQLLLSFDMIISDSYCWLIQCIT